MGPFSKFSYTIATIFLFITILSYGCSDKESPIEPHRLIDELPISERNFKIGVSGLVPRNWPNPSSTDWQDLFQKLPEYGELFGVHTGWNAGELDDENIPIVVHIAYEVTQGKSIIPYIGIGFEPDELTQHEADTYFQVYGEDFKNICLRIAEIYHPGILLLGIEINRYYEKSPTGFQDFITVYREIYDAVKSISPVTKIGSNFLLEYMRGAGALSGHPHEEHWYILDQFTAKIDLVTFTVFPFLDYQHPSQIPSNYFSVIAQHTDNPIMITETGWPSQPIAGINGSEAAQVDYLLKLLEGTQVLPMEAIIWVFPHDPETGQAGGIFDHLSKCRNDGSNKKVFEYWQALKSLPLR